MPGYQATERARNKANGLGRERGKQGDSRVEAWKKQLSEDQRGRRCVQGEIVLLHDVANGATGDGPAQQLLLLWPELIGRCRGLDDGSTCCSAVGSAVS